MTLDIYSVGGSVCLILAAVIALAEPIVRWVRDGVERHPRGLDEETEVWTS